LAKEKAPKNQAENKKARPGILLDLALFRLILAWLAGLYSRL
jgi:hypothetical protein